MIFIAQNWATTFQKCRLWNKKILISHKVCKLPWIQVHFNQWLWYSTFLIFWEELFVKIHYLTKPVKYLNSWYQLFNRTIERQGIRMGTKLDPFITWSRLVQRVSHSNTFHFSGSGFQIITVHTFLSTYMFNEAHFFLIIIFHVLGHS